jgi:glycosyltransferase involved in cell wall biosynthesis
VTCIRAVRRPWLTARLILERFQRLPDLRRAVRRVGPEPPVAAECGERQLLIDVSVLAQHDAGTGIQRATKALLVEFVASPPKGYVVRTIRASRWRSYRYLRAPEGATVRVRPGDIFIGLDLASRIIPRRRLQLLRWRVAGAHLCFVMHDLLPLLRPAWFTQRNSRAYRAWIRTVAVHADSVVCVSQSVAAQFRIWLFDQGFDRRSSPEIGWFHHAAQLPPEPRARIPEVRVTQIAARPFVLMVGTIEPRKGYAQALDAFEVIWRDGHSMQLVIVGRIGWKVESLTARLRRHPQARTRLHWFDNADDRTLHALYDAASGVLVASEAEGFGLPIIEAAVHGKPLLIRDIPVFREIAGTGATYFRGATSTGFVDELRDWLASLANGTAIPSTNIAVQNWAQSARQLLHHALPADLSTS